MTTTINRRLLLPSALASAVWLLFVAVGWGLPQIQGPAAHLSAFVPRVVPSTFVQGESGAWGWLTVVVAGIAVALTHALVTVSFGRRGAVLVAAWFAAVAAGALVGIALDVAAAWQMLASYGPRGLLGSGFGATAASGALWGLCVGWLPALMTRTGTTKPSDADEPTRATLRPVWLIPAAAVSVIALVTSGVVADYARSAWIDAEVAAQEEEAAAAAVTFGAMPDPEASGAPVPEKVDTSTELAPEWCTSEKAMLLKGEPDAATGHRGLPIRLMNFSDEPCVIQGYPDIAFGDQNEHLLAVTITEGGSFMAQDPGPQRIEVPAGGYAVSILGWDAASPHGALVTKTVHAALTPGMTRESWAIELDVVEGSSVAVTAWAIDANPTSVD